MGNKTLYSRVVDLECDVATMVGFVEGLIAKAARWDEHVDRKERLLNRMENARRNKRRKAERIEREKKAKAVQAEVDRENMAEEMVREKEAHLKVLQNS